MITIARDHLWITTSSAFIKLFSWTWNSNRVHLFILSPFAERGALSPSFAEFIPAILRPLSLHIYYHPFEKMVQILKSLVAVVLAVSAVLAAPYHHQ
jgi:hypothetical protein